MLDLLLPRPCVGCGRPDGPWCRACRAALQPGLIERPVPIGPSSDDADGDLHVVAATVYTDTSRRLLLGFKEAGRHEVADVLGELLARAVLGAALIGAGTDAPGAGLDVLGAGLRLVPVPSRPQTRRERGADLGLVLARAAVARLRLGGWSTTVRPLLRHVAGSVDQAGLNRTGRARNVVGTLTARPDPPNPDSRNPDPLNPPGQYLLLDDIVTTGATLREAARAMTAAGHRVTAAAVVAATPIGVPTPLSSPGWGV